MSSTSKSTDNLLNNFTLSVSTAIKHELDVGTITDEDAKILRKVLIRIQTDTKLLNAIIKFNALFLNLDINWIAAAFSVLNNN